MGKSGKTSNESKAKYNAKAYDRIGVYVPKGRKAIIQDIAEQQGLSINGYINTLIVEAIEREKSTISENGDNVPRDKP